ncbi:HotDog domain-containing protein [Hyaloraphidium curvatum]|nr:HotDog domain-containing protein [Hyaloraphidium curvatum]
MGPPAGPSEADILTYLNGCLELPGAPGSFRVAVNPDHTNNSAHLFGGVAASLLDMISSMVLLVDGSGVVGATLALNVQFVAPARVGDVLSVRAWKDRKTKSAAFCRSEIRIVGVEGEKGLVASASHTKAMGPASFPRPKWAAAEDRAKL